MSSWPQETKRREDTRRKIVDVFTVRPTGNEITADLWAAYSRDLAELLARIERGDMQSAQGALVNRVAAALPDPEGSAQALTPIEIHVDNEISERYTVLDIEARDTPGFLYEFSNALSLSGLHISRVEVSSVGNRVYDRFYLTDHQGRKIDDPQRERELRAATVLVKHFTHLLPRSPNPESALLHFREFLAHLFSRSDWPDELTSLENPQVLGALARLLGVSDFLWDDFLRMQHANLFPVVRDIGALRESKPKAQLVAELEAALQKALEPDGKLVAKRAALNAFKDREMFRVDMRHILGYSVAFGQFSAELTDVCEVVVDATYHLCFEHLAAEFGEPRLADGRACTMAVCALGKCGGRELGYASDIELLFIYRGAGETDGPQRVSAADFYHRLVVCFLDSIEAKREGIFEIDLRLRPYGQAGSLAVPLEALRRYFGPDGPAWAYERQALVKLRPIAGDLHLGAEVQAIRDEIVYGPEAVDVAAMRAMRERQLRHLVAGGTINAKFSAGGLVDVEYLVQGLQMLYGKRYPALRCTNTREAIERLGEVGVLTLEETARLRQAHIFMRQLIDALRMVRGNARDLAVPLDGPGGSEEFAFLARRLGYGQNMGKLREDIEHYMADVRDLGQLLKKHVLSTMRGSDREH
ncbi:MAG: hypothetical protein H5T69_10370 [Chloroflexi bacterium]|nr:hypothetical protein [Chloroflexota bacterium]